MFIYMYISIYIIENVGERASAHTPLKPGLTYGGGKDLMGEPMGEMIFKKIQKKWKIFKKNEKCSKKPKILKEM